VNNTKSIIPATSYVLKDEKAIWLAELHKQSSGYKGFHRYQVITVVRDDAPAQFWRDMGPVSKWKDTDPFIIPSLMEHTVAELQEMARQQRSEKSPFDKRELAKVDKIRV